MENLRTLCRPCHDRVTLEQQGKKQRKRIRVGIDGYPIEDHLAEPKKPQLPMLKPRVATLDPRGLGEKRGRKR